MSKKMRTVRLSEEIHNKIKSRAAVSGLRDPVAAIVEGQWDDEDEHKLHLAFYEREHIPKDDSVELVDAGGLDLLIVQREILDKLATGMLMLDGGRIVISNPHQTS